MDVTNDMELTFPMEETIGTADGEAETPLSEDASSQEVEPSSESEAQRLMARIAELEGELERRDTLAARMTRECEEFERYFPEVPLRELPDIV